MRRIALRFEPQYAGCTPTADWGYGRCCSPSALISEVEEQTFFSSVWEAYPTR